MRDRDSRDEETAGRRVNLLNGTFFFFLQKMSCCALEEEKKKEMKKKKAELPVLMLEKTAVLTASYQRPVN